ncbi:Hypothetical protein DHA2_10370 [Giardia duodenalis]|uniref:ATP/GTP binding protein n=1 Tax=Giardia intestinalis TaxID=5741 RepID=V6TCG6_GIAIN|nr:Hypothetical protein DHA2_10370 [Giardia intestinalis]
MEEKSRSHSSKAGGERPFISDDSLTYVRADYFGVDMSYHEKLAHRCWRDIFFCGTELDHYERLFAKPWLFPHLGEDLDTDGALYTDILAGRHVYLFGISEPKLVGKEFLPVPIICAVSISIPLPEQIGIKSVQMNSIDVLSFEQMDLFFREESFGVAKVDGKPKKKLIVKTLALNKRLSTVEFMSELQLNRYKYANLYIFRPDVEEKEMKEMVEPTNVIVDVTLHKTTVTDLYEEKDDATEVAKHIVNKHFKDLPHTKADILEIAKKLKESMNEEKGRYKARMANIKRQISECSTEYLDALKGMRIIKYYPYLDTERAEIRTNKLVNRFYGDATEVKGGTSPYESREEFEQRMQALEAKKAEKLRRSNLAEEKRLQRILEMKKKRESNPPTKKLTRADRIRLLEAELENTPEAIARRKREERKAAAKEKAAKARMKAKAKVKPVLKTMKRMRK